MKKLPGVFRVAVEAVILNDRNQLLLTQRGFTRDHHPGEWETTSGRVDNGEDFVQALKREVMEEIGLKVEVLQPFNTFHFYRGPEKVEHLGVSFLCRYESGDIKVDGDEVIDYRWVDIDTANKIVTDRNIINMLQMVKKLL
jgi:8-oxo-dGTP diphosphatase